MDAKKLLKKHLDIHIPVGVHMSEKQMVQAHNDAAIGAINEALNLNKPQETEVEDDGDFFDKEWKKLKGDILGKKFLKFTFVEEQRVGSVCLESGDLSVWCSPFWDYDPTEKIATENIGINIDVTNDDGEAIDQYVIPCAYPTDEKSFSAFKEFYLLTLVELAKKFNK